MNATLCWMIWKGRNAKLFLHKSRSINNVQVSIHLSKVGRYYTHKNCYVSCGIVCQIIIIIYPTTGIHGKCSFIISLLVFVFICSTEDVVMVYRNLVFLLIRLFVHWEVGWQSYLKSPIPLVIWFKFPYPSVFSVHYS